jgi:hypothetical protein
MAAAVKTTVDARARSLELAEARGYWSVCPPGRSVGLALDDAGLVISYTLRIPSASEADVWHIVTYSASHDDAVCDCHAGQYGRACWHRGVAIRAGRRLAHLARLGWPED